MATYDFSAPRLYVRNDLAAGYAVPLDKAQTNYLANVLRLSAGAHVLIFNGRDGEWLAEVAQESRKSMALVPQRQLRPQPAAPDLIYMFAPLKHARIDYMAQKAVEMGAGILAPVLTRHTQVSRVNDERLEANAVEAAEQCGILSVPEIRAPMRLVEALATLEAERLLIFCDEDAPVANAVEALSMQRDKIAGRGVAVLIGPEGGFDEEERQLILRREPVLRLSLGPRILRADTAAVAALAVVQAVLGDWGAATSQESAAATPL